MWRPFCSKPFSSSKHRNPLVRKKPEIQIYAQRTIPLAPRFLSALLESRAATRMCLHLSNSRLSFSLEHTLVRPVSLQLSPSPGARRHCQIPVASCARGSSRWTPVSNPGCSCLCGQQTFSAHASVCCSQSKRMGAVQDPCSVAWGCSVLRPTAGEVGIVRKPAQAGQCKSCGWDLAVEARGSAFGCPPFKIFPSKSYTL
ncbi:hypothetical protein HJG60_010144 [Phyllostomus discolor]|uniref:Uncharacterized protein n=1 Tax=Phyllostomus discolor TaxID=89673 RepID=A0A834EJN3_9CHIR|nr:hypothetical protein HJG60_010144 [Phyllostomus discolor]